MKNILFVASESTPFIKTGGLADVVGSLPKCFDKKKYDITRTQQIIMLSLCIEGTLTMSQLASKINTSNEQATRAVAQLVDKGFVIRMQNPDNRRVINIRLTDEAMRFMEKMKNEILDDILGKFSSVSDSDMKKMKDALVFINSILKKVLK